MLDLAIFKKQTNEQIAANQAAMDELQVQLEKFQAMQNVYNSLRVKTQYLQAIANNLDMLASVDVEEKADPEDPWAPLTGAK